MATSKYVDISNHSTMVPTGKQTIFWKNKHENTLWLLCHLYIYPTDSQESIRYAIEDAKIWNYLPRLPSKKKCRQVLSEGYNRMAQVAFKPKLCLAIDSTITKHQAKLFCVLTMHLIAVFIIKHNNDNASTEIL